MDIKSSSEILDYFQRQSTSIVEEIEALVAMDTPSGDAGRIANLVGHYGGRLTQAGLDCREFHGPNGPHVLAERPGKDPAIVFVGHSDTVWPAGEVSRRPPRRQEGKLYGPGVFDMKSGLGLIAQVADFLNTRQVALRRRLQVFVSADEEIGSVTAHPHMDAHLSPRATALVPEPPGSDGSLKIARKAVAIYQLRVRGREAHAGVDPEKGVSAVTELARVIVELDGWNDPARGVSVNVGTVRGGTATNVVAGHASCGVDIRFERTADGERIDRRLRSLATCRAGSRLEVEGGVIFPPLIPTPRSRELSETAVRLASEVGLPISVTESGGGSDGAFLAARGFTVLDGLGADGAGAHSEGEHVIIERLPRRAAFLTRLVLELDRMER